MYFYFSSACPSAVKLNGAFLGIINKTVKFCDINLDNDTLVELCSISESSENCNFILNKNFLENIPNNLAVTDLNGGFMLHFSNYKKHPELKVLAQEKYKNYAVTVFNEKGIKISIDTENDFFIEDVLGNYLTAKINFFTSNNSNLLAVSLDNNLYVYLLSEKIEKVFFDADIFITSLSPFTTEKNYVDIAKHKVISEWEYSDNRLKVKSEKVLTANGFSPKNLVKEILPYAFLEGLKTHEDILPYLTEKIKPNADKLFSYLGNFIGIMPPPIFKDQNQIGLVYKKSENHYFVKYLTFYLVEDKIDNLTFIE